MFVRPVILAALMVVFAAFTTSVSLAFLVASVIIVNILVNGVIGTAYEVRNDVSAGQLEVMALAPGGLWKYLRSQAYVQCGFAVAQTVPIWLIFGWTITFDVSRLLDVVVLLIATWVVAVCLAILAGARTVVVGTFTLASFSIGIAVALGGAYYPITLLPTWVQVVARANPVTYVVDALRTRLVGVEPLLATPIDLFVVVGCAVILVVIVAAFTRGFRWDLSKVVGRG
jgi:ABC-2 type transport system permease protein